MTDLFRLGDFRLAGGETSNFKIECDALTDGDWDTLAYLIACMFDFNFGRVEGVPTGGQKLAKALEPFSSSSNLLIVDDVYTTGFSIERHRDGRDALGAVIFARNPTPEWIYPLFVMSGERSA